MTILKLYNSPVSIEDEVQRLLGWNRCQQVNWNNKNEYVSVKTDFAFLNDEVGASKLMWQRSKHNDADARALAASVRDQKIESYKAFKNANANVICSGYAVGALMWYWQKNEKNQSVPVHMLDDEGMKMMQEWNDEFQRPVADLYDWLGPSIYDPYDNENSVDVDRQYMRVRIDESKRIANGRPIVPFCWMRHRPVQAGVPSRLMSTKEYIENQTGLCVVNGVGCMSWGYWTTPVNMATDPTYSPNHLYHQQQQYNRLVMVRDYFEPLGMSQPVTDAEWASYRDTLHNFYNTRVYTAIRTTENAYRTFSRT